MAPSGSLGATPPRDCAIALPVEAEHSPLGLIEPEQGCATTSGSHNEVGCWTGREAAPWNGHDARRVLGGADHDARRIRGRGTWH